MRKLISIVVPCYNEQETVSIFYNETLAVLKTLELDYEMIFVNDGSKDKTAKEIIKLTEIDNNVVFIDLSRNYGKESAMYAGLENSAGDAVIVMDADLQDHPKYITEMVKIWNDPTNDVKIVCTARTDRKGETKIKSWFSDMFYKVINKISDVDFISGVRDYRLLDRCAVEAILRLKEKNRFSKGIFRWVGFETEYIEFENTERVAGETSWNFLKLFVYAIDGIISFSNTPLYVSIYVGVTVSLGAFIYFIYQVIKTFVIGITLPGYASTICLILFMGGMQLIFLGIVGLYIARMFIEIKDRPIYIAKNVINNRKTSN